MLDLSKIADTSAVQIGKKARDGDYGACFFLYNSLSSDADADVDSDSAPSEEVKSYTKII